MSSDTLVMASCVAGIVSSVVCLGIMYRQRSGNEQKNLSLVFNAFLLFLIGFYVAGIMPPGGGQEVGIRIQYASGVTIAFLLLHAFASEFGERVPRWLSVLSFVVVSVLVVCVLLMDYKRDVGLFYACAVLNALLALSQLFVFLAKSRRSRGLSSMRGMTLLFVLFFVPQLILMEHLWVGHSDVFSAFVPLLFMLCQIAITVASVRNRFMPFSDLMYKAVLDAMDDPLFVVDARGSLVGVNEPACALFPECRGRVDPAHPAKVPRLLEPVLAERREHEESEATRYVYVNWNVFRPQVSGIVHEGSVYGLVLRLRDVTEYHNSYLKLTASNSRLRRDIESTQALVGNMRSKAVSGAIQFLREHDETSGEHMRRSSNYTFILARQMQDDGLFPDELTDSFVETLIQVAPLHDVGKFFVAEEILKKPDELTPQEYELVKSHVAVGAQMVERMMVNDSDDLYYTLAREVTLYHHEWWDGSGYMSGLKGTAIPLSARIVSVATVFDLVSTNRPYKAAYTFDKAFDTVVAASGTQFDPQIIGSFVRAKESFRSAYNQMVRLS